MFKLLDSDKTWTPFGTVNPSTHIFAPATNGTVAPNDCLKWGPGITSAGAACNSVTGGATPANQLTIYTSHSGLVANVTTPTEAWTVMQQGFYAPGDGGDAAYQWGLSSYCPGGTSGSPWPQTGSFVFCPSVKALARPDGIILQVGGNLDVRAVGMQPGGQDNSPYVQSLMTAIAAPNAFGSGAEISFPAIFGQMKAYYYFSQPFSVSRNSRVNCLSPNMNSQGGVVLVFAPGVNGVIQNSSPLSPDGGIGQSDLSGCSLMSLGGGQGNTTSGGTVITSSVGNADWPVDSSFTMPASCGPVGSTCPVNVNDGVILTSAFRPVTATGGLAVAHGAYVGAANPAGQTFTLASPYVVGTLTAPNTAVGWFDLPVSQKYTVQTTSGSNAFTVTAGPRVLRPGDMLWSDAFLFGSTVATINNAIVGTPTVHSGGSGYVGSSGTMTWSGLGCMYSYNTPPVLNVTASGGVITGVSGVANAGQCLQSSPGATANWTPGGGLSGGSGASFDMVWKQTGTVEDVTINSASNATVTHTSGAPGQMWVIPGGVVRSVQGSMHDDNVSYFGVGLRMDCQSGTSPPTGCNGSFDEKNAFTRTLVGRLVRGNNSGVSTAIANVYADNYVADEVEAGTLGSTYIGEENNSAEDGTAPYDTLVFCGSVNYSSFTGSYLSGQPPESCLGNDANGNPAIGVPAIIGSAPPLFIAPIYGSPLPAILSGALEGSWKFLGPNEYTVAANAAAAAGSTTIALNATQAMRSGIGDNRSDERRYSERNNGHGRDQWRCDNLERHHRRRGSAERQH